MFGCFISIILWKIERVKFFTILDTILIKVLKKEYLAECVYFFILAAFLMLHIALPREICNFITLFLIIDISNVERKNVLEEDTHFYASISIISRAMVSGFIAPIIYVATLGNKAAIIYFFLSNLSKVNEYRICTFIYNTMTIIPAALTQPFLYFIYIFRNKVLEIDFKGDYLENFILRPLLNIDILGAYIEKSNFYFYFSLDGINYMKNYGEYENKITSTNIKDYLSIAYCICILSFAVFYIIIIKNNGQ